MTSFFPRTRARVDIQDIKAVLGEHMAHTDSILYRIGVCFSC